MPSARAIAKELLGTNPKPMHYREIAKKVLETNMSELGDRGSTPEQTMGAILRKNGEFTAAGRGFYKLAAHNETR